MVAIAILATVLVVLLENHGSSMRLSQRSRQVSVAINLAKDVMTEIEIQSWPELGAETGNFEEMYPGLYPDYWWESVVEENAWWTYVREVTVRVLWRNGLQTHNVEIIQFVAAMDVEQQNLAEEESSGGDDDTSGDASSTGGATATGGEE